MPERGSKTSTVPVVWATFGIFSARSKWFPVGRDWWPWTKPGYITMTQRQSNNQWSGGSPRPQKIPSAKIGWKVLASIFWDQDVILLIDYHPTGQTINAEYYSSAGAIEWHFEGKTSREVHHGDVVLARQCPGSPITCNPEETGLPGLPMSWSPTQFSGSGPVGLPPVPWTKKKTLGSSPFFVRRVGHCCRGDLVWRDNLLNVFELPAKVRATG